MQAEGMACFRSGAIGTPKGAIHLRDAVMAYHATGRFTRDPRPGDVCW